MRPESIQYLAVCFTEEDWDNDGAPDAKKTVQRMEAFYRGRFRQRHVFDVYRRVADTLLDVARTKEAALLYRLALRRWPLHAEAPLLQDRLITALARQHRHDEALLERLAMSTRFGAGSAWDRRHRKDAAARKRVRALSQQALLHSAVALHTRARARREAAVTGRSAALLERARKAYAHAAATYQRYVEQAPRAPNVMRVHMALGDCRFYSRQFAWAALAYARVRDGARDAGLRQEAAFAAAKALEQQVAAAGVRLPAIPRAVAGKAGRQATLPGHVRRWQAALDSYVRLFPRRPRTSTLAYKAAELSMRYRRLDDARKRFAAIYRRHCKEAISTKAGSAILTINVLQSDERRAEVWAARLRAKKCGGAAAAPTAREAWVLQDGIKLRRATRLLTAGKHKQSAAAFLSAAEGALRPDDAVTALLNAGAAMERGQRNASAAAAFERAFARQKTGKRAGQALWRAARAHERAGHFKQATARYLLLARGKAFAAHKRRLPSTLGAALLLEKDQQYGRAAALLLRYARLTRDAGRAATEHLRAASCLRRAGDHRGMGRALKAFVRRFGKDTDRGPQVVEAHARLGVHATSRGQRRAARRHLGRAVALFRARGLPAAGRGAEWAARAAFALADAELRRFRAQKMRGSIRAVMRQKRRMERQAVTLRKRYTQVYALGRARWSLGATFRQGEVLEHFARTVDAAIRAIPVPAAVRRMGPDAVDAYLEKLDLVLRQQVDPISDAARELFRRCVLNGRKLKLDNRFTRDALTKMRGYEPDAWPLPAKDRVERAMR